jgi:hypothetical protein
MTEILTTEDFAKALVGRTIIAAQMDDEKQKYEEWNYSGGDIRLVLDDGSILATCSFGYDMWGNRVSIESG